MPNPLQNRVGTQHILTPSNKSNDLKLFEIFQIYKDDLQRGCPELYYALLGWEDRHLSELRTEQLSLIPSDFIIEF